VRATPVAPCAHAMTGQPPAGGFPSLGIRTTPMPPRLLRLRSASNRECETLIPLAAVRNPQRVQCGSGPPVCQPARGETCRRNLSVRRISDRLTGTGAWARTISAVNRIAAAVARAIRRDRLPRGTSTAKSEFRKGTGRNGAWQLGILSLPGHHNSENHRQIKNRCMEDAAGQHFRT
jgi:hypothetical protein